MRAVIAAVAVSLVLALAAAQTTAVWESGLDTLITNVPFSKSLAELPEVKAPSKTAAPGRSGHCTVWYKGSMYIFGGKRGSAVANDLWRYDAAASQWEFLLGAKEPNHPGTQALPASRAGHTCSVDNDRFLVFGGHKGNSENLADVWAYSFAHNNWLQLSSGQRIPSYTSGMLSHPGARTNHAAVFDAKSKTLVIIGGRNSQGLLNDVWQYEVEKGLWHFLAGAQKPNAVGEYPKYGKTKSPALGAAGLAEPKKDVVPGARENTMCAAAQGRIVCYGGKGYAADTLVGTLSDVWSFNLEKKKWRFLHGHETHRVDVSPIFPVPKPKRARQNHPVDSVGGTSTAKKLQQYFRFRAEDALTSHEEMHAEGALCPGGRFGGVFGIDTTENIAYVLGGLNSDEHVMNDMWSFDLVKRKWSFIRATTKSASYGTKGKESGAFPPARAFSSAVVTDSVARKGNKRFLLFGGQGEVADTVFADVWSVELVKPVRKPRPAAKPGKPKANKPGKPSTKPGKHTKPKAPPAAGDAGDAAKDATVNNPFDKDVSKPEAGAKKPDSPDVKPFIPTEPPVVTGEVPIDPDCCGKGKTPVLVGPYNIPSKETRAVRVIGDKSPEIHLDIPAQTSWYRPHLDEAKKYVPKSHRVITDVKKKHKKLRYSPLVEN